jgi:transcriptional regulator with XRE-family HTH domain
MTSLRKWREGKGWTQADIAGKIGEPRPTYQKMESGEGPIWPEMQAKIRKVGYTGPWPREEAQEAAAPAGANYVTREELAELRGAVRAHIEQWERGQEKVLRRLEALARKLGLPAEDV